MTQRYIKKKKRKLNTFNKWPQRVLNDQLIPNRWPI